MITNVGKHPPGGTEFDSKNEIKQDVKFQKEIIQRQDKQTFLARGRVAAIYQKRCDPSQAIRAALITSGFEQLIPF